VIASGGGGGAGRPYETPEQMAERHRKEAYEAKFGNLPAVVDGPGREGQLVVYVPNLKAIHEKLMVEEGPPKQHFKTFLSVMGGIIAFFGCMMFPIVPKIALGVIIYGCVHMAVYTMFFKASDYEDY
jgi:hypothetical protein